MYRIFRNFKAKTIGMLWKHLSNFRTISSTQQLFDSKKILRTYNIPHLPKDPPEDYQPTCVDHNAFEVANFFPASAFRQFRCSDEILGPDANKNGCYKNPEYFGYHRFSFATLQNCAIKLREERIKGGETNCICKDDMETDGECDGTSGKATDTCENVTHNGE